MFAPGRRIAVVFTGLVLVVAGCGADKHPSSPARTDRAGAPAAASPERPERAPGAAAKAARRRALLARLERSPTIRAAVRRALLTGAIARPAKAQLLSLGVEPPHHVAFELLPGGEALL